MTLVIHGTAVSIAGKGVLLRGVPGAGKSSLALRLIDQPGYGLAESLLRARLVSDDQVIIERLGSGLWMTPPQSLAGKIEIRGLGIVSIDFKPEAELCLIADLESHQHLERMPEPVDMKAELLGVGVPCIKLSGSDLAAPAKLRAALCQRVATAVPQR